MFFSIKYGGEPCKVSHPVLGFNNKWIFFKIWVPFFTAPRPPLVKESLALHLDDNLELGPSESASESPKTDSAIGTATAAHLQISLGQAEVAHPPVWSSATFHPPGKPSWTGKQESTDRMAFFNTGVNQKSTGWCGSYHHFPDKHCQIGGNHPLRDNPVANPVLQHTTRMKGWKVVAWFDTTIHNVPP